MLSTLFARTLGIPITFKRNAAHIINPKTMSFFPSLVTKLPDARNPIQGVESFVFQGENQQVIFMACHRKVKIPFHSQDDQMKTILKGKLNLTIYEEGGSKIVTYHKGDTYHIPKGIAHSSTIIPEEEGYMDLTIFNNRKRYKNGLAFSLIPELVRTPPLQINPKTQAFFPNFITKLPDACVGLGGDSFLIQGAKQQSVLMAFYDNISVPPHSHKTQVGIILKGKLKFTTHVDNSISKTVIYEPGDIYCVPENVIHSATIIPEKDGYMDFTFFDQPNRYGKFKEKEETILAETKSTPITFLYSTQQSEKSKPKSKISKDHKKTKNKF